MVLTLRQFVRDLQNALGQASGQRSLQLGKGSCKDFEEYKKITGMIAGLEAAGNIADQMLRQVEDAARESDGELPEMPPAGTGGEGK